jgi:hypothetical protein
MAGTLTPAGGVWSPFGIQEVCYKSA